VHYANVMLSKNFNIVVLSKKEKIPLGGSRYVWEDTFEMDLKWKG